MRFGVGCWLSFVYYTLESQLMHNIKSFDHVSVGSAPELAIIWLLVNESTILVNEVKPFYESKTLTLVTAWLNDIHHTIKPLVSINFGNTQKLTLMSEGLSLFFFNIANIDLNLFRFRGYTLFKSNKVPHMVFSKYICLDDIM